MTRKPRPEVLTRYNSVVDLLDPDPASINLADIEHALNRVVRFTGHTTAPWTVAQHSLLVAVIAAVKYKATPAQTVAALLHDAHEAYTGDITTPVRRALTMMVPYARLAVETLKQGIQRAVHLAFGMPPFPDDETTVMIQRADADALATEADHFMHDHPDWADSGGAVIPWVLLRHGGLAVLFGPEGSVQRLYDVGLVYQLPEEDRENNTNLFRPFGDAVRRAAALAGFVPPHPRNDLRIKGEPS